jgi:hypothetical protein
MDLPLETKATRGRKKRTKFPSNCLQKPKAVEEDEEGSIIDGDEDVPQTSGQAKSQLKGKRKQPSSQNTSDANLSKKTKQTPKETVTRSSTRNKK